jgi:histidine phosphotransfer protein HptB
MSDLVNLDELEQLKEIMEDEFEMLISLFINDSGQLLDEITQAYATHDNEALRIAAHTLKGSSSNMCVMSISDISKEIEAKANANNMQGIDALIGQLKTIHPQVSKILQSF